MAAPTTAPSDEERKNIIISHMNQNHTRELSHYLRHYIGLSSSAATSSPSLRDVSLKGMLIRANGIDYDVPFSPPVASWADVKTRIIAMDTTAREALGISDIYITTYAAPRGFDCVVLGAVSFYFACAASLPWVVPGSPLWDAVTAVFPGGPAWFKWIVKAIFIPVVAIHVIEAVLFDKKRMQRHGVPRWSTVWLLWEASVFMEGATAWWRIDGIIAEKRRQKETKKH